MDKLTRYIDNGAGWKLELTRWGPPTERDPVVMVPGYAMNTFILGYHPSGPSMIEYLVQHGFQVWTVHLRGQGGARRFGPPRRYGMAEQALDDLPLALAHIRSRTGRERLSLVGCSLGASLIYGYLAHHRHDHGVGAVISIGGPFRWDEVHPLVRIAMRSPRLAGAVRVRGTRELARRFLPLVQRHPVLLRVYMNADLIDLDHADQLVNTVDDPVPWINRQIAHWVHDGDLMMRGVNVSQALAGLDLPTLCVLANADGIVPPAAALSVAQVFAPGAVSTLEVGDEREWFAHADLFVSRDAPTKVFEPMRAWLAGSAAPGLDAEVP